MMLVRAWIDGQEWSSGELSIKWILLFAATGATAAHAACIDFEWESGENIMWGMKMKFGVVEFGMNLGILWFGF